MPKASESNRVIAEMSAKAANLTLDQIWAEVDFYNADFSAYDNEIYARISSRLAHWVNYNAGGWFTERIDFMLDYLVEARDVLLIDLGFSISYLKAKKGFSDRTDLNALLVEKYESAKLFDDILKVAFPEKRDRSDHIVIADIETPVGCDSVVQAASSIVSKCAFAPKEVLISAIEFVEHLEHVSEFWKMCENIQKALALPTRIYVTLPICNSIPSHAVAFRTPENALAYLRGYMDVDWSVVLTPPDDLIANSFLKGCVCAYGTVRLE